MDNLINFKEFVKENPSLMNYVKKGDMTWQQFYEMYDLYGQNSEVWNQYLKTDNNSIAEKPISTLAMKDIFSWFKEVDVDKMQESINSVQRVISVIQDFGSKSEVKEEYKPRPVYKHFED